MPRRTSYTVQVAFVISPREPDTNTGHMVDGLMALLDDLDTADVEPGFSIDRVRWQRTTTTEDAR